MPSNRTRRTRNRATWAGGITEADYIYFTWGDFFEAEGYTEGKTEAELKAFWHEHKEAIMARFYQDEKQRPDALAGRKMGGRECPPIGRDAQEI